MWKLTFSDVDGTLVHKEDGQDCKKIPNDDFFLNSQVAEGIQQYRDGGNTFVVVTGRRYKRFTFIDGSIPYDFGLCEHGCLIVTPDGFDREWAACLEPTIGPLGNQTGPLWDYARKLVEGGYRIDSEGRFATVRVFLDKPDNLSEEQKCEIEGRVCEEGGSWGITTTRNINMVDLLPKIGGKVAGIDFLLRRFGKTRRECLGIGDDINDLGMLEALGFAAVPGNAKPQVRDLVTRKGGYVSPLSYHEGSIDIIHNVMLKP